MLNGGAEGIRLDLLIYGDIAILPSQKAWGCNDKAYSRLMVHCTLEMILTTKKYGETGEFEHVAVTVLPFFIREPRK